MRANAYTLGWLTTAIGALLLASCSFDTSVLDARRCDDNTDCDEGFFCDEQGICQSVLADLGDDSDADEDMEEPDPCTDFDGDEVFGGEGCNRTPFDCNDLDPVIFEGADEICDLKDNDCDELTDTDDNDYIVVDCPLVQGVCEGSEQACVDGILQTCTAETYGADYRAVEEGDESACDGLDNDCDGDEDESIFRVCYDLSGVDSAVLTAIGEDVDCDPGTEGDCVTLTEGRPCQTGLAQCFEGEFSGTCAGQVVPISENTFETRCDVVDNNCDGAIDEDCRCLPGEERPCYTGDDPVTEFCGAGGLENCRPNAPCRVGRQVCGNDARFGACLEEVLPVPETCGNAGVDNDCDGNALPSDIEFEIGPGVVRNLGDSCTTGEDGLCNPGTYQCVGAAVVCVRNVDPQPETCDNDGADDDCDGGMDNVEGLNEPCRVTTFNGVPVMGQCQYGRVDCNNDDLDCRPASATTEVCNYLDDNCASGVDEGVNTTTDPDNCGSCGLECSGGTPSCCEGGCVNLTNDIEFCGNCGTDCRDDGSLEDPACCSSGCRDLAFDEAHCGNCGNACSGATDTCCEGGCVDTDTDINHCGGCDMACDGATQQCCGGACVPKNGQVTCGACDNDCSGSEACRSVPDTGAHPGRECIGGDCWACKALIDPDFCGPAGADCDDLDATRPPGAPATDFECCTTTGGPMCVDFETNVEHCQGCSGNCTTMGLADPACCGSAGCRDLDFDEAHCGACGNACGANQQCCGGRCISLAQINNCGDCGNACGAGEGCCAVTAGDISGGQADGGCVGADCAGCVDLSNGIDRSGTGPIDFCGTCNISCSAGSNVDCCSGFCTSLTNNNTHCGSCGNACDVFGDDLCVGTTCQ